MRPSQLESALMFHAQYRQPCIALSRPGAGKSSIYRKVFRKMGLQHHTINLALSDGVDMRGLPNFSEDRKSVHWIKEHVYLERKPMAIFVDETFQGPIAALNSVAPLFLENRIDDVHLDPGSWVCGASNRLEDKAGTNRVPSHIPNRVTILNGPDSHIDDWAEYMIDGGSEVQEMSEYVAPLPLPTERDIRVIQFLRMKPNALNDFDPSRLVNGTERQWEWVATFLPSMPDEVQYDIIAGRVGEGSAAELRGFLKIAEQLPSREQILLNPTKCEVPTEPSALYLVSGMLAQAATVDNFESVCEYAKRIPPEFQAMLVKDAMRMCPAITSTKSFVVWGCAFAEVLR